ncbi:MAG: hypothetical protein ACRBEQ_00955 [Hyphomonas sp.]
MSKTETRDFQRSDIPALMTLIRANGFPNRSVEGWTWALFDNPEQGDAAPGLISLKDGEICAFVGVQIRQYSGKAGLKRVAMGHTLMSSESGRGQGLLLARRVIKYRGVDAMQTNSSNPKSAPLLTRMGVTPAHPDEGRQYVDWIVRPGLHFLGRVMNFLARSERVYRAFTRVEMFGRKPKPADQVVRDANIKRLDFRDEADCAAFDRFSQALSSANVDVILPVRSANVYAWRLADPDLPRRTEMLAYFNDGRILAVIATTLTKPNAHEPWVSYVTDFASLPDEAGADVQAGLINEARRQTRLRGASLMRFKPSLQLPKAVLQMCGRHVVKTEPHDYCFVNFAAGETDMQANFAASPYEGDLIFALRTPLPKDAD